MGIINNRKCTAPRIISVLNLEGKRKKKQIEKQKFCYVKLIMNDTKCKNQVF